MNKKPHYIISHCNKYVYLNYKMLRSFYLHKTGTMIKSSLLTFINYR